MSAKSVANNKLRTAPHIQTFTCKLRTSGAVLRLNVLYIIWWGNMIIWLSSSSYWQLSFSELTIDRVLLKLWSKFWIRVTSVLQDVARECRRMLIFWTLRIIGFYISFGRNKQLQVKWQTWYLKFQMELIWMKSMGKVSVSMFMNWKASFATRAGIALLTINSTLGSYSTTPTSALSTVTSMVT